MKTSKYFLSAILCITLFASCSDDDDGGDVGEPNEEEIITDVTLTFVNDVNPGNVVTLRNVDPDGDDGPLEPQQTVTGTFFTGSTYTATVDLYNSIEDEDVTAEVRDEEPDEHYFIYGVNGLDMTFSRSATDIERMDGNFLGYETIWTANAAGMGELTIQLFHESENVNDSENNGFGSQTGGSTDVNVTFEDVVIQ